MGIITRSALFIKFAKLHSATIRDVLVNHCIRTIFDLISNRLQFVTPCVEATIKMHYFLACKRCFSRTFKTRILTANRQQTVKTKSVIFDVVK